MAPLIRGVTDDHLLAHRCREREPSTPSVSDLQDAIRRYIREHNGSAKPFVWTQPAETILAKLRRLPVSFE